MGLCALRQRSRAARGGVRCANLLRAALICLAAMLTMRASAVGATRQLVAVVPVLQYVQSQQLPNRHVRILLQFSANPTVRTPSGAATTNFVLQFLGSVAAPTVPGSISVNLGPIQLVSVAQLGNALTVTIAMSSAVRPRIVNGNANGLILVDVPPASNEAATPYANPYQQAPAVNAAQTQTKIVRLRYADVSEVVGILTSNGSVAPGTAFNPQPSQLGSQNFQGFNNGINQGLNQGTFGQTVQPFQQFGQYQQPTFGQSFGDQQPMGQRVSDSIAIDRRLNAVIITGTPDQIAQAQSLIASLDIPVASVLLDTQVIEVTETGAKQLGLDYNQAENTPLTRVFNTQSQIINNVPTGAVAGSVALQSNIFLLVSQGHARVLASPKIMTQDGVPASILTGDSLPIRVTTPVGVGGVGAVSSQVEYINVGVNLQILPRVTTPNGVDANVYSQVSSVTGFTSSNDPQISTRQAQTKVNLLEGQTLVIGGLLQQRDIRNLQKIPILGDLPLVGALFRFYTETRQNTNLVIAITPHVIPAPANP